MPSISELPAHSLASIEAVLTDIDDTLTTHGRLPACAYDALEKLHLAGVRVIPVTGRPAGWCDHIARMWPVDGVVGENGAFYFRYDSAARVMKRVYAQTVEERDSHRKALWSIVDDALQRYPGTAIASDQAYREIDVAIDFCEDVSPLPDEIAYKVADMFKAKGAHAKVSSIHVNAWFGDHDKLSTSLRLLKNEFGISRETAKEKVAYAGDSPNDAPMFGYFPIGIGVANITRYLDRIESKPGYLTVAEGGEGFSEFATRVLSVRQSRLHG